MTQDPATRNRSNILVKLCLLGLAELAVLAVARIVQNTAAPLGCTDLHPYWLHGITLRQGSNPYRAGLENQSPKLPVRFLDGVVIREPPLVIDPRLNRVVVNTAPLALILFQLSRVSWPLVKWLWVVANLGLALLVPRLVIAAFPGHQSLTRSDRLLIALIFYGFVSTRVAVWVGQTTLVVFALMLVTLLVRQRNVWLAGLCLGLALSKYSLAIPLLLFLLFVRKRSDLLIVGTALLVQLAGLLVVSVASGDSPLTVGQNYVQVFLYVARWTVGVGAQLSSLVPNDSAWWIAGLLSVLALAAILALGPWRRAKWPQELESLAEYHVWVILVLLVLLAAYHGIYDWLAAVVFLPLALCAVRNPARWQLSRQQTRFLVAVAVVFGVVFILPGSVVGEVLPWKWTLLWLEMESRALTLTVLLATAVTLWLLKRLFWAAHR